MSSYIREDGAKNRDGRPANVRMVKVGPHQYVTEAAAVRLGLIATGRTK